MWFCVVWAVGTSQSTVVTLCCLIIGNNSFNRWETVVWSVGTTLSADTKLLFDEWDRLIQQMWHCCLISGNNSFNRWDTAVWSVGTTLSTDGTLCCLISGNNSFNWCKTVVWWVGKTHSTDVTLLFDQWEQLFQQMGTLLFDQWEQLFQQMGHCCLIGGNNSFSRYKTVVWWVGKTHSTDVTLLFGQWEQLFQQMGHCVVWSVGTTLSTEAKLLFDEWEKLIQQMWHCCLISGNNSFNRCDTVVWSVGTTHWTNVTLCSNSVNQSSNRILCYILGGVNTIHCRFSISECCPSVSVCSMYSIHSMCSMHIMYSMFLDVPYPQMLCFRRTHKTGRHLTLKWTVPSHVLITLAVRLAFISTSNRSGGLGSVGARFSTPVQTGPGAWHWPLTPF